MLSAAVPPLPRRTRLAMVAQIVAALENLLFGMKPAAVHIDVTSFIIFVEADMRACLGNFDLSLLASPDACATGGTRDLVCCTAPG